MNECRKGPPHCEQAVMSISSMRCSMEVNEMETGSRDQGGQALEEFERRHDDMCGAITVRRFELKDELAFWCATQPFVAKGGAGDVVTELTWDKLCGADAGLYSFQVIPQRLLRDVQFVGLLEIEPQLGTSPEPPAEP